MCAQQRDRAGLVNESLSSETRRKMRKCIRYGRAGLRIRQDACQLEVGVVEDEAQQLARHIARTPENERRNTHQ